MGRKSESQPTHYSVSERHKCGRTNGFGYYNMMRNPFVLAKAGSLVLEDLSCVSQGVSSECKTNRNMGPYSLYSLHNQILRRRRLLQQLKCRSSARCRRELTAKEIKSEEAFLRRGAPQQASTRHFRRSRNSPTLSTITVGTAGCADKLRRISPHLSVTSVFDRKARWRHLQ